MGKSRKEHRKGMLITSVTIATNYRTNGHFTPGQQGLKTFKVPFRQLFTFSIDINSSASDRFIDYCCESFEIQTDTNANRPRQSSLTKLSVAAGLGSRLQKLPLLRGAIINIFIGIAD